MIETTAAPFPTIRVRPWLGLLAVASSLIATLMRADGVDADDLRPALNEMAELVASRSEDSGL